MHTIDREIMQHPILELEAAVSRVLATMEVRGIYIDQTSLKNLEKELTETIKNIETDVQNEIQKMDNN
jgi:DNA polymerase I-like protein with 3'-5' exonuclease and polymerase domains